MRIIDLIQKAFADAGYAVLPDLSNAIIDMTEYGVPQNRKRIIILGVSKEHYGDKAEAMVEKFYSSYLPEYKIEKKATVRDAIGDLPKLRPLDEPISYLGRNYDKQDNISDTTKYEDHFVAENRLIAISKSGRSMDSEDVQNFLNATERGIDVQLFVRKNKDDKISKEFYYLGRVIATGNAKQFVMPNTDKTAVEIEWELETPVREDIYQYIVNE